MSKNIAAKNYQKKDYKKKACEGYHNLSKDEKGKKQQLDRDW